MLLALEVEKVYSPLLLATLRLKRRMSSSSSSPRLFVSSHPQQTVGVGVRPHDEGDPLRVTELHQLDKLLKPNS